MKSKTNFLFHKLINITYQFILNFWPLYSDLYTDQNFENYTL